MTNTVTELRRDAGLTQSQLAALSGVAQPNIAAYERGTRRPSAKMLARLAEAAKPRPSLVLEKNRVDVLRIAARHHALDVKVFGSVAQGTDTPGSDIDLVVRFAPGASMFDLVELQQELEESLGLGVDVVSVAGLGAGHTHILREARPL